MMPDQYGKKVGSDRNSNKNSCHDKDSETNVQALLHHRSLSDDEQKLNVSKVVTSNETKREVDRVFTFDEEDEKIEDMFGRFSNIIASLNLLGRKIPEREVVRKILRSLTPQWNSKVIAIKEGINYDGLTYDQLRGNLITHEITFLKKS
ncbi:hypothetical protein AHAS_Ahas02G0112500 [Arachis hypogaea]